MNDGNVIEPKAHSKRRPPLDRRWFALLLVCTAQLMIVLDGTVVNVALPAIRDSLGFSETGLSWVVNAYLLTFGGFLLLGGRPATCSGGAGCSHSDSHCSRWPRCFAGSPEARC